MEQIRQNKEFIIRYFNAMSGNAKTREVMEQYITDEELIGHITFFETAFPRYDILADEITAEGNRVVVRARLKGVHAGEFHGIKPTYHHVDFPFVIAYEIENGKIVNHWLIADQLILMEQLGISTVNV